MDEDTDQERVISSEDIPSQDPKMEDPRAIIERLSSNERLRADIQDIFDAMGTLELQRQELNDQLKAYRDTLVAKGISRPAVKFAHKLYKMTEGAITDMVIGLAVCSKAVGKPMQLELLLGPRAATDPTPVTSLFSPPSQDDGGAERESI